MLCHLPGAVEIFPYKGDRHGSRRHEGPDRDGLRRLSSDAGAEGMVVTVCGIHRAAQHG